LLFRRPRLVRIYYETIVVNVDIARSVNVENRLIGRRLLSRDQVRM